MKRVIDSYIIPYVFKITTMTLRFKELLIANRIYQEGINFETNIHRFKMRLGRLYTIFFGIWFLILIPPSLYFHSILEELNTHVVIILTALLTGFLFLTLSMFKEFLVEKITLKIIKESWIRHLPLFDFDLYSKDIALYYGQAVEEEISIGNLQQFIFDKLSTS